LTNRDSHEHPTSKKTIDLFAGDNRRCTYVQQEGARWVLAS